LRESNAEGRKQEGCALREALADLMAGRLTSALEILNRCLAREPALASAHSIRAAVHLRLDRLEEARRDIDRALELRPGNAGDLHNRAVIWTALERYDRAIDDYEAVLRIDPESAGTLNNLAWVLATAKDPRVRNGPRALAYARGAVRGGDSPAWLDTLAAAFAECGDFASAVATEEEALRRFQPPNELFKRRLAAYRAGRTFTECRESDAEGRQ